MSSPGSAHFRQHGGLTVAALILFFGTLPVASAEWYLLPLLVVPLVFAAWALRSGTDADVEGLRVRALVGQRRIPWSQVAELRADDRGRAVALLSDGRAIRLTAVPASGLPRLIAASGQQLTTPDTP